MFLCLSQSRYAVYIIHLMVDFDSHKALFANLIEEFGILSLAFTHKRCDNHYLRSDFHVHHIVYDLVYVLLRNRFAALCTMRQTYSCEQQT